MIDRSEWRYFKNGLLSPWILKMLGWRINYSGVPVSHGIIVVYPHTSNIDFLIGVLFKWSVGLPARFLGKASLFTIPLIGSWLRYLGGRPVVRSAPQGYVKQLAQEMRQAEQFLLVITPEGTRGKTAGWRSGFYHLALETAAPIGFAYIDYSKKEVGLTEFAYLTGNVEQDTAMIDKQYEGKVGRYPDKMSPIQLLMGSDKS